MSTIIDFQQFYYKEIVLKKEKSWIQYYATLYKNAMVFTNAEPPKSSKSKENNTPKDKLNFIEINTSTRCFHDVSTNRFPFVVQTGTTLTKFKCETNLQRYKWMFAIRLCANGKPPQTIPNFIETKSATRRRRTMSNKETENLTIKNQRLRSQSTKEHGTLSTVNAQRTRSKTGVGTDNLAIRLKNDKVVDSSIEEDRLKLKIKNTDSQLSVNNQGNLNINEIADTKNNVAIERRKLRRRSHSNIAEEEHMKQGKKTVKWDMRNAIRSYVSKNSEVKKSIGEINEISATELQLDKFHNEKHLPKENTSKRLFKRSKKSKAPTDKDANENTDNATNINSTSLRSSFSKVRHLKTHSDGGVIDMRLDNIPQVENLSKVPREDDELNSSCSTSLFPIRFNNYKTSSTVNDIYNYHSDEDILNHCPTRQKHLESLFSINIMQENINNISPNKNISTKRPGISKAKSLNNLRLQQAVNIPERVTTFHKRGSSAPVFRFFKSTRVEPEFP